MQNKTEAAELSMGMLLKTSRESLQMTTKEVSNILKVKERDVVALERDTFSLITSHLYMTGFVKSYAKLLKINEEIIEQKIKKLSISSNVDNKKHRLVNLEKDNKYSPDKETFFNTLLIFLMLSLLLFSFDRFDAPKFNITDLIIDKLK